MELGKHTGLSAALLSQLERGKLFPTLPTRLRIATIFEGRARFLLFGRTQIPGHRGGAAGRAGAPADRIVEVLKEYCTCCVAGRPRSES